MEDRKTITPSSSSSSSSSSVTKITFSKAFLDRSGLGEVVKAPLTLCLDEGNLRNEEPCVITIRSPPQPESQPKDSPSVPEDDSSNRSSSSIEDQGSPSLCSDDDNQTHPEAQAETLRQYAVKEELLQRENETLRKAVENLEKEKAELKEALDKAREESKSWEQLCEQGDAENRKLMEDMYQLDMEEQDVSCSTSGTQTDSTGSHADEAPVFQDDASIDKVQAIELYTACFFDKCVTHALRKVNKPKKSVGSRGQPRESIEPGSLVDKSQYDIEMFKVLSAYFYQQFASQAERDLMAEASQLASPSQGSQEPQAKVNPNKEEIRSPEGAGDSEEGVSKDDIDDDVDQPRVEEAVETPLEDQTPVGYDPHFTVLQGKTKDDLEKELLWTMQALTQRMDFLESQHSTLN